MQLNCARDPIWWPEVPCLGGCDGPVRASSPRRPRCQTQGLADAAERTMSTLECVKVKARCLDTRAHPDTAGP